MKKSVSVELPNEQRRVTEAAPEDSFLNEHLQMNE